MAASRPPFDPGGAGAERRADAAPCPSPDDQDERTTIDPTAFGGNVAFTHAQDVGVERGRLDRGSDRARFRVAAGTAGPEELARSGREAADARRADTADDDVGS